MKYAIKLPEHNGEFIRTLGSWGEYHKWLEAEGLARYDGQLLVRLPQQSTKTQGRNDPCNCGSGKKYKKCCLNKNRR
jgi:uncharacterized protein YchJ|tara:strand:+ start:775 stop:1005 length:231 start_codon:yes stop_codon:yes gene_type:complete